MRSGITYAFVLLFAGALAGHVQPARAQVESGPSKAEIEGYLKNQSALVGFEWAFQPLDRIILVKGPRSFCAIRFLSYRRANDGRPATSFDTGEASEFAIYEVSELAVKGMEVVHGPAVRRELDYRGMRGVGRLAFHIGDTELRCGRDKYSWIFPTGIRLKEIHADTSIAPTSWTSYGEILLDHPNLHWYQRDEKLQRPMIIVPQEDLPD